jgi:hypothetical protein
VFPPVWLRLALPRHTEELDDLLDAASDLETPIDISTQPGLWGGRLRGANRFLTYTGSNHFENATDSSHAANLVEADLIQTLSAIGHETIDVYFLKIRRAVEEFQIHGVLEALESAKLQGHVRFLGLCSEGNPFAALSMWQFHDAFELLQTPHNPSDHEVYDTLAPLARERRVGIVTSRTLDWLGESPFETVGDSGSNMPARTIALDYLGRASAEHPVFATVRSAAEVRAALSVDPSNPDSEESQEILDLAICAAAEGRR